MALNKQEQVLEYLQTHDGMRTSDFEELGIKEGGSVIARLRKKGFEIETIPYLGKNSFGKTKREYIYRLL